MNTDVSIIGGKKIWFLFLLISLLTTVLVVKLAAWPFQLLFGWSIPSALFITLIITLYFIWLLVTIYKAWTQVPENYRYIVELFGSYIGNPLEPGLNIIFPWFGWVVIRNAHFMGVQKMELYLDEKKTDQYGGGDVEFKDCSSPISAFFYFQVNDAQKATYNIDDVLSGIEEKADHLLRAFLGMYTIDTAITLKSNFSPAIIASCVDLVKEPNRVVTQAEFESTEFYSTLQDWGVEVKDFVISDIKLPPSVRAKREEILTAEKKLEISKIDKKTADVQAKTKVIEAGGIKKSIILIGEGEGEKLKIIMQETQATGSEVINLMVAQTKWDAVKNAKGNVIITAGNDMTSLGAQFGAGTQLTTPHQP